MQLCPRAITLSVCESSVFDQLSWHIFASQSDPEMLHVHLKQGKNNVAAS